MKSLILLPVLLLAGCLSAPAQDQDRAGEQRVRQAQISDVLSQAREAEKSVTINVSMTGEGATLNFQPNELLVSGDVETGGNQSAQGSTDATQGATQTPTATQDIAPEVTIPLTE